MYYRTMNPEVKSFAEVPSRKGLFILRSSSPQEMFSPCTEASFVMMGLLQPRHPILGLLGIWDDKFTALHKPFQFKFSVIAVISILRNDAENTPNPLTPLKMPIRDFSISTVIIPLWTKPSLLLLQLSPIREFPKLWSLECTFIMFIFSPYVYNICLRIDLIFFLNLTLFT